MRKRQSISEQLRGLAMSDEVLIASRHARRLVESEARRNGSTIKEAIRPVARRLRAPYGSIWALLFRPPKRRPEFMDVLQTAVMREIELEIGALNVELAAIRSGARRLDPGAIAEVEADLTRLKTIMREGRP